MLTQSVLDALADAETLDAAAEAYRHELDGQAILRGLRLAEIAGTAAARCLAGFDPLPSDVALVPGSEISYLGYLAHAAAHEALLAVPGLRGEQ